jgi:hypothetical protein
MKKVAAVGLFAVAVFAFTVLASAQAKTMTGWVTETHCGAKGANAKHKECGLTCVEKKGAKVAFYDNATKKVYEFDEDCQKPMLGMMAQEVTLSGVEMKDGKIHASKAEPAGKMNKM